MRILFIGFLALVSWSSLSTYLYVCKIRGLCTEQETAIAGTTSPLVAVVYDSIPVTQQEAKAAVPQNLVIHFAFDKSEFTGNSQADKYFAESNTYLKKNSLSRLSITGHTDAVGSGKYNQDLGYRRAQAMKLYFESKGIPSNMIRMVSKGENEPADDNNTISGRANNRRADITINN